jgi:hypothetical protein
MESAMDVGVWMSREVLAHKRDRQHGTQVWNLRRVPQGLGAEESESHRLFVAVEGHWRGFFRLRTPILHNPHDPGGAYALVFDPGTWTAVLPERAPVRRPGQGFTLAVSRIPAPRHSSGQKNETEHELFCSLLEREEKRESASRPRAILQ